jgi:hypothetical protein
MVGQPEIVYQNQNCAKRSQFYLCLAVACWAEFIDRGGAGGPGCAAMSATPEEELDPRWN